MKTEIQWKTEGEEVRIPQMEQEERDSLVKLLIEHVLRYELATRWLQCTQHRRQQLQVQPWTL